VGPQAFVYLTKEVITFNHVIRSAPRVRLTDSACLLALDIWHWCNTQVMAEVGWCSSFSNNSLS